MSRKVSRSGSTRNTISALASARASDGRSEKAWGDAPGGTSSLGSPTPSMTAATSEWTGAIDTTTSGAASAAGATVAPSARAVNTPIYRRTVRTMARYS